MIIRKVQISEEVQKYEDIADVLGNHAHRFVKGNPYVFVEYYGRPKSYYKIIIEYKEQVEE